jgi:hypothetical protein
MKPIPYARGLKPDPHPLNDQIFEKRGDLNETVRILGPHHPETMQLKQAYVNLLIQRILVSEEPSEVLILAMRTLIANVIEEGFGDLLEKAKNANDSRVQEILESI